MFNPHLFERLVHGSAKVIFGKVKKSVICYLFSADGHVTHHLILAKQIIFFSPTNNILAK